MILELKVRNFLSFKEETTLSFEATADKTLEDYYVVQKADGTRILKMMMVYGANASGKSNLISVFDFLHYILHNIPEEKDVSTTFVPFKFGPTSEEPGEFELIFYIGETKYKYNLILNEETILSEKLFEYPGTQPALIFERTYDDITKISIVNFGTRLKISKQAIEAIQLKTLKNMSVIAAYNQVNISIPEVESFINWWKEKFITSIDPYSDLTVFSDESVKSDKKAKKQTLEFLKKADFNITDVIIEEKSQIIPKRVMDKLDSAPIPEEQKAKLKKEGVFTYDEVLFTHKVVNDDKVEYYSLPEPRQSQGTLRFYGLSGPFYYTISKGAFLPIDEIGSALHPLLVLHFMREFLSESKEGQLIFTTHNMTILNEKELLRKDAIWFTEKKENGSTDLFSMSDFPIRKELSYYNAYKLGKFGAIPEL